MGRPKGSKNKSKGLGDVVEKVAKKTGIKKVVEAIAPDCGCDKRRDKLNRLFPFKRCLNEDERNLWKDYMDNRASIKTVANDDVKMISKIYADSHRVPYYEPCRNCSPKPLLKMIDSIDKLYNKIE